MAGASFGISTSSGCSWRILRQGIRSSGFASARGAAQQRLSHRRFPQCCSHRWHSAFTAALPDKEEHAPAGTQPASVALPYRGSYRTARGPVPLGHCSWHHPACPPQKKGFRAAGWGEAFQHQLHTAGLKTPIISHDPRIF